MSVFKAYDIRGIWGKEIDEDLCYKAGLPDGSWKKQGARLFWYEGFKFQARG